MDQNDNQLSSARIELLRKKINNEEYIHEAILRIAQILSDELLTISQGGGTTDEQWEGRE